MIIVKKDEKKKWVFFLDLWLVFNCILVYCFVFS